VSGQQHAPAAIYPRERLGTHLKEAGWAPGPVWTAGKSRPHRDSILDHPARSKSLYLLSYPAHTLALCYIECYLRHRGLVCTAVSADGVIPRFSLLLCKTEFLVAEFHRLRVTVMLYKGHYIRGLTVHFPWKLLVVELLNNLSEYCCLFDCDTVCSDFNLPKFRRNVGVESTHSLRKAARSFYPDTLRLTP